MDSGQIRIACAAIRKETESAILIETAMAKEEIWLPLSQVHSIHRNPTEPYIYVTPWIAKQKGLL